MADLSQFVLNAEALRNGEWIDAGAEYAGIRLLTKGLGSAYADRRAEKMKAAARKAGGEDRVPQAVKNRIDIEALGEVCLLDIDGLNHPPQADGTPGGPVTIEQFREIICLEEAAELAVMAFKCAQRVGQAKRDQAEQAAGN